MISHFTRGWLARAWCCATLLISGPLHAAENDKAYLFTSFQGDGDGLHLSYSKDANQWTNLSGVFLKPELKSKLFRDAHLLLGPDGVFRLTWTTGWHDKGIGYASSTDLIHWSEQKYLPFMENVDAKTCWAPETFYDAKEKQYIITWSSDVTGRFPETESKDRLNHRAYYVVTKDFETFSEPKLLFDPGFDNIDTTIIPVGSKYVCVMKEGDKQGKGVAGPIHYALADAPLGPYKLQPTPIITQRAEGPTLISLAGKTRLFVDYYADGRYGVYETSDWKKWDDISSKVSVVQGQRHGTVLQVPTKIVDGLIAETQKEFASVPKPILEGHTADPGIRVFGDTYYVYPTSDKPNWQTTDFSVWSSKNLIDWKKEGMILDVAHDLKWANIEAWAPDCIESKGTYYFFFCGQGKVGVATSKKPTGPFKDALGHPMVQKSAKVKTFPIDPYPFMDDDGQPYLFLGNGLPTAFKLNKNDLTKIEGDPITFNLREFREGIVVFKRKGIYYYMWSIDDARSPDYRVGYGMSDTLFGPVRYAEPFIVLRQHGLAKGTAHHSVLNIPGTDRWYTCYHRHAIPDGNGYTRETCLTPMEFNEDGTIKPMDPLRPAFEPGSQGEPLVNGKGKP
jgi:Glycosyl hydrolases family 43